MRLIPLYVRQVIRRRIPRRLMALLTFFYRRRDATAVLTFLNNGPGRLSLRQRAIIIRRFYKVSQHVECPHTEDEMLQVASEILKVPAHIGGCVVEAGSFRGGSTSKLSIAARLAGRRLIVFDSFQGMPPNDEQHGRTLFGSKAAFPEGSYRASLVDVRRNVEGHGELEACHFVPGWFQETLPHFQEPVVAGYLDVDLAESTRVCLRYLYPLLIPGGTLFSQDGHLPLVTEVLKDRAFWRDMDAGPDPQISGLDRQKLVKITKPRDS